MPSRSFSLWRPFAHHHLSSNNAFRLPGSHLVSPFCRIGGLALLLVTLSVASLVANLQAQDPGLTTLHTFSGGYEIYDPILGSDGNLYGGDSNTQTIYKLTPTGDYSVVYNFVGTAIDGPSSSLLLANDGNFYGIAHQDRVSLIYQLTPAGIFSVLHTFAASNAEGSFPFSNLTQGADGNIYGTTGAGGTQDDGTVYKLSSDGTFVVLYNFLDETDELAATLVQGQNGVLYGSWKRSDAHQEGTIFSVTPAGVVTTLYDVNAGNGSAYPSDLILGQDGNLYGTSAGGADDDGTVFSITPTGIFTVVYAFKNPGGNVIAPVGRLLQTQDGSFYGATDGGSLFKLAATGALSYLHYFSGSAPTGDLLRDKAGNLYGLSTSSNVTVFQLSPPPTLSLFASAPSVTANTGQVGAFKIALSFPVTYDLSVSYAIKGSGENGIDYQMLSGTVKIKAGKTAKTIKVVPPTDYSSGRPKVAVKLTLQGSNGYILGDSTSAKVKVFFPDN